MSSAYRPQLPWQGAAPFSLIFPSLWVRGWVLRFGPVVARRLRRRRARPSDRWHLDEMVVQIAGGRMYVWRAVDHECAVLDMLVQRRRSYRAALRG
jgi:putative transposase